MRASFLGETQVMHENVYFENKELFPANWNQASDRYGPTRMAGHLSIQRMQLNLGSTNESMLKSDHVQGAAHMKSFHKTRKFRQEETYSYQQVGKSSGA